MLGPAAKGTWLASSGKLFYTCDGEKVTAEPPQAAPP